MSKFRGLLPSIPDPKQQAFGSLFFADALPPTPATFGQQKLIADWGMLGNDKAGDCMFAGMAHASMYLNAQIGVSVEFIDAMVLADYGAVTGFPAQDPGTEPSAGLAYWRQIGMLDAANRRHRIDGSASLPIGDVPTLLRAAFLLGTAGIGFALPDSAETQFDNDEPWDVLPNDKAGDGHWVTIVGCNSKGNLLVITWGRLQAVTPAFIREYMIYGAAPLSLEWIQNNVSPRGVNQAALAAYVNSL